MDYLAAKTIHQAAVALSFGGFFVRGLASLRGARWVRGRAARTLPHVVDSVLLASAFVLAWSLRLDPTATPWLAAKIAGLFVYIGLGVVALRPVRSVGQRAMAWIAALVTFGYIVSVAITKHPAGILTLL